MSEQSVHCRQFITWWKTLKCLVVLFTDHETLYACIQSHSAHINMGFVQWLSGSAERFMHHVYLSYQQGTLHSSSIKCHTPVNCHILNKALSKCWLILEKSRPRPSLFLPLQLNSNKRATRRIEMLIRYSPPHPLSLSREHQCIFSLVHLHSPLVKLTQNLLHSSELSRIAQEKTKSLDTVPGTKMPAKLYHASTHLASLMLVFAWTCPP